MKSRIAAVGAVLAVAVMGTAGTGKAFGDALADDYSKDVVRPAITFKARAFDLRDVRVGDVLVRHQWTADR